MITAMPTSRSETTRCEYCEISIYFNHDKKQWTTIEDKPIFNTTPLCSEKCFNHLIVSLEGELQRTNNKLIRIKKRLNAFKRGQEMREENNG
jgi:hypothetical protein